MNQRANIYVKAHLVRKLLFEYKDTHTHRNACFTWTTKVFGNKNQ